MDVIQYKHLYDEKYNLIQFFWSNKYQNQSENYPPSIRLWNVNGIHRPFKLDIIMDNKSKMNLQRKIKAKTHTKVREKELKRE